MLAALYKCAAHPDNFSRKRSSAITSLGRCSLSGYWPTPTHARVDKKLADLCPGHWPPRESANRSPLQTQQLRRGRPIYFQGLLDQESRMDVHHPRRRRVVGNDQAILPSRKPFAIELLQDAPSGLRSARIACSRNGDYSHHARCSPRMARDAGRAWANQSG